MGPHQRVLQVTGQGLEGMQGAGSGPQPMATDNGLFPELRETLPRPHLACTWEPREALGAPAGLLATERGEDTRVPSSSLFSVTRYAARKTKAPYGPAELVNSP